MNRKCGDGGLVKMVLTMAFLGGGRPRFPELQLHRSLDMMCPEKDSYAETLVLILRIPSPRGDCDLIPLTSLVNRSINKLIP